MDSYEMLLLPRQVRGHLKDIIFSGRSWNNWRKSIKEVEDTMAAAGESQTTL